MAAVNVFCRRADRINSDQSVTVLPVSVKQQNKGPEFLQVLASAVFISKLRTKSKGLVQWIENFYLPPNFMVSGDFLNLIPKG